MNASYLVIAGGIVVLVSMLLPWAKASFLGHAATDNAFKFGWWPTLAIAGAFTLIRGYGLMNPSMTIRVGTPWISAVWVTIALVLMYIDVQGALSDARGQATSAGIGSALSTSIGIG